MNRLVLKKENIINSLNKINDVLSSNLNKDKWYFSNILQENKTLVLTENDKSIKYPEIKFQNHDEFINNYIKYKFDHQKTDCLPKDPVMIKGVFTNIHGDMYNRKFNHKYPTLSSSEFLEIKFYPSYHYYSQFRKSTFAYTFNNFGGYEFNDPKKEEQFKNYKGIYKKHPLFCKSFNPNLSSFKRCFFRKLFKGYLFNSLKKNVKSLKEVKLTSGIYMLLIKKIPVSIENKDTVIKQFNNVVKLLISDNQIHKKLKKRAQMVNINPYVDSKKNFLSTINDKYNSDFFWYTAKYPFLKN